MNNEKDEILKSETEILGAEKEILQEIKKEEKQLLGLKKEVVIISGALALIITGALIGLLYFKVLSQRINIDKSTVMAPQIDLAAKTTGPLEEIFVNIGDEVPANAVLARVGDELIKAKTAGLVIAVKDNIGQLFPAGTPIVSMIDPNDLRIVGQIDENKGLSDISVGQSATFTIDAFGNQKFNGVVDEITPTADSSGIVFSISDKRETKQFDVKIRYDIAAHPEFKNGMSAKITIYKN